MLDSEVVAPTAVIDAIAEMAADKLKKKNKFKFKANVTRRRRA
jgi:hypothetical protein